MRHLTIATCVAALVLSLAASTALGSTGIRVGAGGAQALAVNGVLIKSTGGQCNIAFTFNTNGVINKSAALPTGESIVNAVLTNCTGPGLNSSGNTLANADLAFDAFTGTLPNITSITFIVLNAVLTLNTIFGRCTYSGNIRGVRVNVTRGIATNVDFSGSSTIPRIAGSALCPAAHGLSGALPFTGGAIPLTLI